MKRQIIHCWPPVRLIQHGQCGAGGSRRAVSHSVSQLLLPLLLQLYNICSTFKSYSRCKYTRTVPSSCLHGHTLVTLKAVKLKLLFRRKKNKKNYDVNRSCYTREWPFKEGKSDQDLTLHHMCAVHMDQTAHMSFHVKRRGHS